MARRDQRDPELARELPGAFGELAAYDGIIQRIERLVPIWRHVPVSAGYERYPAAGAARRTDHNGFIVRHDGTLCDLFHRIGVPYSVTPETTIATPMDVACRINLEWIFGLMGLAAA